MEFSVIPGADGHLTIKDFETIKKELESALKTYKGIVFTANDIKAAKEYRAHLNKTAGLLKDTFTEKKKELFAQLYTLESQTKELVAIVDDCTGAIDAQIKAFEAEEKAAKLEECKKIFSEVFADFHKNMVFPTFEQISNERWLNKTFALAKVAEEMRAKHEEIDRNIETLERLDAFSFEAKEEYFRTLDINRAIAEGQRQADIQRRKEEARKLAEEEARKAATTPVEVPEEVKADNNTPEEEKAENGANTSEEKHELIMTVDGKGFRAIITDTQKAALNTVIRDYLKYSRVDYEKIGG